MVSCETLQLETGQNLTKVYHHMTATGLNDVPHNTMYCVTCVSAAKRPVVHISGRLQSAQHAFPVWSCLTCSVGLAGSSPAGWAHNARHCSSKQVLVGAGVGCRVGNAVGDLSRLRNLAEAEGLGGCCQALEHALQAQQCTDEVHAWQPRGHCQTLCSVKLCK